MRILRSALASLCALMLGAHCLRAGWLLPLALCLAALVLAWVPRAWSQRAVALTLALGALEWLRTLLLLRAERLAYGQPALRMTLILAAVAVVTAATAGWLARTRSLAS